MCCMYIHSGKTFMHIKITPPKFNFFNFLKILRFLLLPMIYIKISIFSISLLALVIFKKFLRLYFNYISTFPLFPPNLPPMSLPSLLQIHGLFFFKKINCYYIRICIYICIPKNNLSSYNVTHMYVFRTHHLELDNQLLYSSLH